MILIGQEILGYTIKEEIGSGGFGTVYRCEKTNRSGVYVRALKHITLPTKKQYQDILNSMGGDYEKANEYFSSSLQDILGEIQILNHLTEIGVKNVVSYYENQIDEQMNPLKYDIYILMEYLTSFPEYLEQNSLTVRDVIRLGKDILTALEACHNNRIIHRDIKDDNIFVGHDGVFKLGDFGVSKKLQDRFGAESVRGTLNYIAPEVYQKRQKYDYTVDLYSLGIVLYKLLNGNRIPFLPLFPEPYNNLDEERAFNRRMNYELPDLPIYAKNDLGQVILKAMMRREHRYNSANEFFTALCEAEKSITNRELNQIVICGREDEKAGKVYQPASSGAGEETVGIFNGIIDAEFGEAESGSIDSSDAQSSIGQDFSGVSSILKEDFWDENQQDEKRKENSDEHIYKSNKDVSMREGRESKQEEFFSNVNNVQQTTNRKTSDWIFYLLPIGIVIVYVLIYMVYLPHAYDKTISIADWIVKNPKAVIEELQNSQNVFPSLYKIIFWKLLNYAFFAGFIVSLYVLGRKIQFAKPEQSVGAVLREREAYYMIMESYEAVKQIPALGIEVQRAIKTVYDRLKNETDFGYGNERVIQCENEIEHYLKMISSNIAKLNSQNTEDDARQEIVSACQMIMAKLKIRTELKKK